MSYKVEFLIKEMGCDKLYLILNPSFFTYSLEKRLIPRNLVRKLLKSNEFPLGKRNLFAFARENKNQFKEKFIHPYEYVIPGLCCLFGETFS
jgi:mTERF